MVVQVVACDGDEYHAVAIEGASPLLPLSWLLVLAGWKYLPKVDQGKMRVSVQSPEGIETELTERSKMHYLDYDTFWAVLSDVWRRNTLTSGMTSSQLMKSLSAREAARDLKAVTMARPASIRFLEMKVGFSNQSRKWSGLTRITGQALLEDRERCSLELRRIEDFTMGVWYEGPFRINTEMSWKGFMHWQDVPKSCPILVSM